MTIVNRRTFIVARGKNQEALDLLCEGAKDSSLRYRIYSSHYGKFDQVALEVEFESMAHAEQAWAEFDAQPGAADFMAKWNAVTESGGLNELWVLEAQG